MMCENNMMASKKKLTRGMLLSLGVCMMISYGTFGMNDSNEEKSNDNNNNNQNNFDDAQLGNNIGKKINDNNKNNMKEEKLDDDGNKEFYKNNKFYNDNSGFVNNQDDKFQKNFHNFQPQIVVKSEDEEYMVLNDTFKKNPYNNNDSDYISMNTISLYPTKKEIINKHMSVTDITNKIQNDAYYLTKFKNTLSDNGVQLVYQGCCGGCCGNGAIDFKNTMIKYGENMNKTISLNEFLNSKYGNDGASSLENNKNTNLPLFENNNINNNLNTQNTDDRIKTINATMVLYNDSNLKKLGDALDKMLSEWEVSKPGLSGQKKKTKKKPMYA